MSKFDETRENFIEYQSKRIKELTELLDEKDAIIEDLQVELTALQTQVVMLNTYLSQLEDEPDGL